MNYFGKPQASSYWDGNKLINPQGLMQGDLTQQFYPGYGHHAFPQPGDEDYVDPAQEEEEQRQEEERERRRLQVEREMAANAGGAISGGVGIGDIYGYESGLEAGMPGTNQPGGYQDPSTIEGAVNLSIARDQVDDMSGPYGWAAGKFMDWASPPSTYAPIIGRYEESYDPKTRGKLDAPKAQQAAAAYDTRAAAVLADALARSQVNDEGSANQPADINSGYAVGTPGATIAGGGFEWGADPGAADPGEHGCVIATHAVGSGAFTPSQKRQAVVWCSRSLHGKWWGEAVRRGYKKLASNKVRQGKASEHYDEFQRYIDFATGKNRSVRAAATFIFRTIQFFIVGVIE